MPPHKLPVKKAVIRECRPYRHFERKREIFSVGGEIGYVRKSQTGNLQPSTPPRASSSPFPRKGQASEARRGWLRLYEKGEKGIS